MEDYTQLTRRSSDDGALSDVGGDGGPLSATSKRKVSPPLSWERSASVHAPLAPFAAAPAAATTKKNISFSDRILEEEDEDDDDEEDDDIGEELRRKLGKQLLCSVYRMGVYRMGVYRMGVYRMGVHAVVTLGTLGEEGG